MMSGIDAPDDVVVFFHDYLSFQLECWRKFAALNAPFSRQELKLLHLLHFIEMLVGLVDDLLEVMMYLRVVQEAIRSTIDVNPSLPAPVAQRFLRRHDQ